VTGAPKMKFFSGRPFADPEVAACKLIKLANAFEPVQDGRIYIELLNGPFLYQFRGTPAEYKAGLDRAIANGWLWLHESGTYVISPRRATSRSPNGPNCIGTPARCSP
jgi:hypothetical protein